MATLLGHPMATTMVGLVGVGVARAMPHHHQPVWPLEAAEKEGEVEGSSRRLVDAAQRGDLTAAAECLRSDPPVADVNYAGAVWLRVRRTDVSLREEVAGDVQVEYDELRTDASPLFLAAHAGDLPLVRFLLGKGADVNQKLYRGYPLTAATREGHAGMVELLLKAGSSQPACNEALVEASLHGQAHLAGLIMDSHLVQTNAAIHALVTAATRGFVDVVQTLIKHGVNPSASDRILLYSLKPPLHTNFNCTALFAAIVSRQVSVVRLLLKAGVHEECTKVRLGAWSWDTKTGEEVRVGAGLAEPYCATWCAVEYYESSGTILQLLLQQQQHSCKALHHGRNLLHHAILCANPLAVCMLLTSGFDREFPVQTNRGGNGFRPIHMAARLGLCSILQILVDHGCALDARTESGETAAMLSARYKHQSCLTALAAAGADLGLVNTAGASAALVADSNDWSAGFQCAVLDVILSGKLPKSSNSAIFNPMTFAVYCGDVKALESLLCQPDIQIDEQDKNGDSPVMVAAKEGRIDVFRFLAFAGADLNLQNICGQTAIDISKSNEEYSELLEQVMLDFAIRKGDPGGFYALHYAARSGDFAAVHQLMSRGGYDVNSLDRFGYTPLMMAAKEGNGAVCELLIACGAKCDIKTQQGETALSLARMSEKLGAEAEKVIMDKLATILVLGGGQVKKHTKCGKGSLHRKVLKMLASTAVLRWGKSSRKNVVCRDAAVGGSPAFQGNWGAKSDQEQGLFRVVTTTGKEVHFVCEGGKENAELWVRGIKLVTKARFDQERIS